MSDFLDADINELLGGDAEEAQNESDRAYKALLEQDEKLLNSFGNDRRKALSWPEPVRKKHIR